MPIIALGGRFVIASRLYLYLAEIERARIKGEFEIFSVNMGVL